jgi:hypothetical protein
LSQKQNKKKLYSTKEDRIVTYRVWWGDVSEGEHLENPGVESRIILKRIFNKWIGESWTEDKDLCAIVNEVMKLRLSQNAKNLTR